MFDLFGPRLPRQTIRPACTNWHGHRFIEARNGEAIFCQHCGEIRKLEQAKTRNA